MRAFAMAMSFMIALGWTIPAAKAASGCVSAAPACHAKAPSPGASKRLHRRARMSDWYLHRPSSPAERAQTRRLNREFLASSRTGASSGLTRAQDQAQAQAQLEREAQYQRDLRQYEAAKPAFDRERAAYYRSLGQPAASGGPAAAETTRRDPWHGYNASSGNGY